MIVTPKANTNTILGSDRTIETSFCPAGHFRSINLPFFLNRKTEISGGSYVKNKATRKNIQKNYRSRLFSHSLLVQKKWAATPQ